MTIQIFTLKTCDSCRKAKKFLNENGIGFEEIAIRENPPTESELRLALSSVNGDFKKLFNTSGKDYRDMNLKEKLPSMMPDEAISLLASNGNLIKRPLLQSGEDHLIGFSESAYEKAFLR